MVQRDPHFLFLHTGEDLVKMMGIYAKVPMNVCKQCFRGGVFVPWDWFRLEGYLRSSSCSPWGRRR